MTTPCEPSLLDTVAKISFTLLGALVGASLTAYSSRLKLRRLRPALERRILISANACKDAYSTAEAAACIPQLDSAIQFAQDVIGAGLSQSHWQTGVARIEAVKMAATRVTSAPPDFAADALKTLREEGKSLLSWVTSQPK